MRIVHEASLHETDQGNSFVTLTYRPIDECSIDEREKGLYLPQDGSLSVPKRDEHGRQIQSSHFQAFMKRLRKRSSAKLKFFQCGEYGSLCRHGFNLDEQTCPLCNVGRPHHHAILFNRSFDDLEPYGQAADGRTLYTSPELESIWGYGIVDVSEVNFKSAAYVSRYCLKKVTGEAAEDHYRNISDIGEILTVAPEYATMSNGIGKDWYEKFKQDLWPSDEVPVPGVGVVKKVPRYYEERLKDEDEQLHEEIKFLRQKFRDENADEYTPERLWSKYKVKKAQTNQLIRG